MKRVIFTDNPIYVRQCIGGSSERIHFLCVGMTKGIQLIRKQIINDGMEEQFIEPRIWINRDLIGGEFAKALDALIENNRSLDWWAYNFVSKSPIATKLFERIAWSIVILNFFLKNGMKNGEVLIVLSDDREIFCQVKALSKDSCTVLCNFAKKVDFRDAIKNTIPLAPIIFFLKKTLSKIIAMYMFRKTADTHYTYKYIFLSLLNTQSFPAGQQSYRDFYFAPLIEHLSKSNNRCLNLVLIWPPYRKNLKRLKQCYPLSHDVLPLENILNFGDLIKVFKKAFKKVLVREKIQGDFYVQGYSFLNLLKMHKRREEFSSSLSLNMMLYYVGRRTASRFAQSKVIYPFENRAFERMFIRGIKDISAGVKLFGYQHSALTKRHLNYFLGDNERKYMPLPDKIVTTGEVPRDILREFFGHTNDRLVAGSSLRGYSSKISSHPRQGKIKNILVIVSTDIDEYKRVLLFLDQLFRKGNFQYNVSIRPHPVISLSLAVKDLPKLSFEWSEQSPEVSLNEALYNTDLVLFASSTVSVEALSAGVPIVYLDVSPFLNNNPLEFFLSGCEKVSSPDELIAVLDRMNNGDVKLKMFNSYIKSYLCKRDEMLFERILEEA